MSAHQELSLEVPTAIHQEMEARLASGTVTYAWLVALYRRAMGAKLGATGEHPYGRMGPDDQGELAASLEVDRANGVVRLTFGKAVQWVAMPAAHARHMGKVLLSAADALDRTKA